ncbi:PilZ domain-containing protein [Erythrobacter ani]|uniref:PilZ domain-containing protein n=1 Tax=Erythrobacter ani TaxID=2827235 RepID=A0ABS6SLR7_9SPHN|nr:PilZ domain-containing protein [Erythrobacter ani]MBV7265920.1 PilZ domain-containing protein [Erythrobacter ani]
MMTILAEQISAKGLAYEGRGGERRNERRHQATYRPCCVIASDRVTMGLIRNFSNRGALIEVEGNFSPGDKISYFWESNLRIYAKIVWHKSNTCGVENMDHDPKTPAVYPPRSVRVPSEAQADYWIRDEKHTAKVENISLGGMRIRTSKWLAPGALMTIGFCGLEFGSVSIRWSDGKRAGLRFAKRLTRESLAQLLLDERFKLKNIEFGNASQQTNLDVIGDFA